MPEFLHEVVKKREREQSHRSNTPNNYLTELHRQMQESYERMMGAASTPASSAVFATEPSRVNGLTTIYGRIAVRTRSANQVDEYIRQNMIRHGNNLGQDDTHSHPGSDMQWVLEEVSASAFMSGFGQRHFTYSCSLCGARVICSESVPREVVGNAGLAV